MISRPTAAPWHRTRSRGGPISNAGLPCVCPGIGWPLLLCGVIANAANIVVALKDTIRIMTEIDVVIDAHSGWPIE